MQLFKHLYYVYSNIYSTLVSCTTTLQPARTLFSTDHLLRKKARRFDTFRHRASSGDQAISQEGPSLAGHHLRHHGRRFFPHFPIRMHLKKFRLERFFLTCGEMFSRIFQVDTSFCVCVWGVVRFQEWIKKLGVFWVPTTPGIFKGILSSKNPRCLVWQVRFLFGFWSTSIKLGVFFPQSFRVKFCLKKML